MSWNKIYNAIHARFTWKATEGKAQASVQWKGTNVCMDIWCTCGHHSHLDDFFAYSVKCPGCGKVYACNENIELVELLPEEQGHLPCRNPDETARAEADQEAMRRIVGLGGEITSEVEVDPKDPTLVHVKMTGHPPPGYAVLVMTAAELEQFRAFQKDQQEKK